VSTAFKISVPLPALVIALANDVLPLLILPVITVLHVLGVLHTVLIRDHVTLM
jgi:hypothetical protein